MQAYNWSAPNPTHLIVSKPLKSDLKSRNQHNLELADFKFSYTISKSDSSTDFDQTFKSTHAGHIYDNM